jgi:dihydrofolate reductase
MSLDGYIATKDGNLEFLSIAEKEGEDYGYNEFVKSTDAVIIGRKTYDKVLEMGFEYPHIDKEVYIITRTKKPSSGTFKFYTGDIAALIERLKSEPGKNIYCDGGAEIANTLLMKHLIDELIISVIPVLLGEGIELFRNGLPYQYLQLLSAKSFDTGLVQLHYKIADK